MPAVAPRRHGAWRALGLLGALLLGCCSLTPHFETPQLSVVDVRILGGDLWSQRLKVRLHVQNPNDRELPVRALQYTIEVEGQTFATGESTEPFVVPPLGASDFDMTINANLAGTVLKLIGRGPNAQDNIAYHLTGKLSLSHGFLRSIPFDQRGSFSLQ
jgi:LEA14-like dessication related protein